MGRDTLNDEPGYISELREISAYLWDEGLEAQSERLDEIITDLLDKI